MATAVDITLKVLYVKGTSSDVDDATLLQLRAQAPELDVTVVANGAEALSNCAAPWCGTRSSCPLACPGTKRSRSSPACVAIASRLRSCRSSTRSTRSCTRRPSRRAPTTCSCGAARRS